MSYGGSLSFWRSANNLSENDLKTICEDENEPVVLQDNKDGERFFNFLSETNLINLKGMIIYYPRSQK